MINILDKNNRLFKAVIFIVFEIENDLIAIDAHPPREVPAIVLEAIEYKATLLADLTPHSLCCVDEQLRFLESQDPFVEQ